MFTHLSDIPPYLIPSTVIYRTASSQGRKIIKVVKTSFDRIIEKAYKSGVSDHKDLKNVLGKDLWERIHIR